MSRRNERPVVVVGNDTDLLVMLVVHAEEDMSIFMLMSHNPPQGYSIKSIRQAFQNIIQFLLFILAGTGCYIVSAIYNQGKRKALALLEREYDD